MPRSLRAKAIMAIDEDRAQIIKANEAGILLEVVSSKPDSDTLRRVTYRTMVYRQAGELRRTCSCPAPRRCYHLELAELLWKPGPHEVESGR